MSRLSIPAGQHRPKPGPTTAKRAEKCPRCSAWCRQKTVSNGSPSGLETKQCAACRAIYDVEVIREQARSDYERLSRYRERVTE